VSGVLRISAVAVLVALTAGCATTAPRFDVDGPSAGLVELSCLVNTDGSLNDCRVEREEPAGAGFGEAALSGAAQSRVTPGTVRQAGENARIRVTMRFTEAD